MLEIKGLKVNVDNKQILNGLNLKIEQGEVVAIMGPNGSGKSTLSNVIAGKAGYNLNGGKIVYQGLDLTQLKPEERSSKGIFLAFQYPVEIPGIANSSFLRTVINSQKKLRNEPPLDIQEFLKEAKKIALKLNMEDKFLSRELNVGFSGGEKKKNEIFQLFMLKPCLAILDEIDSGLDIDSIKTIAAGINSYRSKDNSIIIITHYQRILEYIKPDRIHILGKGKIVKSGDYKLALMLEEKGYKEFIDN